jgi:hypothetical protein
MEFSAGMPPTLITTDNLRLRGALPDPPSADKEPELSGMPRSDSGISESQGPFGIPDAPGAD